MWVRAFNWTHYHTFFIQVNAIYHSNKKEKEKKKKRTKKAEDMRRKQTNFSLYKFLKVQEFAFVRHKNKDLI